MHSSEIIIYVIIGILISSLVTLAICESRNILKHNINYRAYVESVQIGDTFGHDLYKFSDIDDPFNKNYNTLGFDPYHCVTILDIKKNNKGETWVKYCFTRNINKTHCLEWSDEINAFLRYRTRISKRIDNINTEE